MDTAFTHLFGLRHPIMQAPMGGVSSAALAAAVSNAGGMGMLACAGMPAELLRQQIRETRQLTNKPFGVNLLLPLLQAGQVEVCCEERVPLLSLFWGDAAPHVGSAHASGAKVMIQVGSAAEARQARDLGVDIIVAQGFEAGGHVRGSTAALPLVPTVVDAVRPTPVLAAGGLADGRGLVAVLALGAAGGVFGTRFLASDEAAAHPEYKRRIVEASPDDTYHSTLFDLGWPEAAHRVLRNSTVDAWERAGRPAPGARPGEQDIIGELQFGEFNVPVPRYSVMCAAAGFRGQVEAAALYAGQSCGLVHDIRPAAAIVEDIAREAEAVLAQLRQS